MDKLHVGVFVVDKNSEIVLWNNFMATHSDRRATEVIGQNLYACFPELPHTWLEQKINNVFLLKNFSFTTWENRPYLFQFQHNRPITGNLDFMRQNCSFMPIRDDETEEEYVCISIYDTTDTSIYETLLKDAVKTLAEASSRDGLTNLHNRRYLVQNFEKEFQRARRYGNSLSFLLLDLDHFKAVNDNYGHLMGDEVLRQTACLINESLRATDTAGRYGGEEFAIILPETGLNGAMVLAERLRVKIASTPVTFNSQKIRVTTSIGVAQLDDQMDVISDFIHAADTALYYSKENRRNQVTAYTTENGEFSQLGKQIDCKKEDPLEDWIIRVVVGYR